jgi:T5SS/PEP-CTERM-associated repeat protein
VAAVAAVGLFAAPSHALDRFWTNSAGGSFHAPANWGGFPVPGAADNAVFTLNALLSYPVFFNNSVSSNRLLIRNDAVDLDLGSAANTYSLLATVNPSLVVGDLLGNEALLSLYVGTLSANASVIGNQAGSSGDFLVDGPDSTFLSSRVLTVGNNGTGLLTVQGGALARSVGLTVAANEMGSLVVDTGGTVQSTSFMTVADGPAAYGEASVLGASKLSSVSGTIAVSDGAVGYVDIDGVGSQWSNTNQLDIGYRGEGTVSVINGASLSAGGINLGTFATGDGQLEVFGGASVSTGNIVAGQAGLGAMFIQSGGTLTSSSAILGSAVGASGSVSVSGVNSRWTLSGPLVAGHYGLATILIDGGGVISAPSAVVAEYTGSDGAIFLAGGGSKFTVAGALQVGLRGSGSLQIDDGAGVTAGTVIIGGDSIPAMGTGTVSLSGAGSSLAVSNQLTVGADGSGYLVIDLGAAVSSPTVLVGAVAGGSGVVEISGASSALGATNVYLGGDAAGAKGSGEITVSGGSALNVANTLKVWSTGQVTVNGGTINAGLVSLTGGTLGGSGSLTSPVSSNNGQALVQSDTLTLAGPLAISTRLSKLGAGTLQITGPQTHASGALLEIHAGFVDLGSDAGSAAAANLTIHVNNAATLIVSVDQHLAGLNIGNPGGTPPAAAVTLAPGGDKTLHTRALSIGGGGILDLNDNDLVVHATADTRTGVLAELTALIQSARAGGAWSGAGITSSLAAANAVTGLAIALNDQGNGTPLNPAYDLNVILVKYTYNGDVNLDGTINLNDYFIIDSNYLDQTPGVILGYAQGDVNFDGAINLNDYFMIDSAYLGQGLVLSGAGRNMVLLPEPGALLLPLGLALLLPRRVRHRTCQNHA